MSKHTLRGQAVRCLLLAFLFVVCLASSVLPAFAADSAGDIEMSTPYPGMTVNAGNKLSFDLNFTNSTGSGQNAALSVASIPTGWKGHFSGNDSEITRVFIKKDVASDNSDNSSSSATSATFELTVPDNAAAGDYPIVLKATTDAGLTSTLKLDLAVVTEELGTSTFTAQYPEQKGASGTAFSFSTTLVNNSSSEQSYSLGSNAPQGWQVTFTPSGETNQVASVTVDAKKSQALTVAVTPPQSVQAGDYKIDCSAASAADNLTAELSITVTGSYSLQLTTPSGLLSTDGYANKESAVTLSVVNKGNTPLENVNLTATAPDGWNVRFDKSTIDTIEAGGTVAVTAYIKPSKDALTGDYVTAITAKTSETSSEADMRVSVKTQTVWGFVGVLLIAAVCVGLVMVFRKFGRR